MHEAWKCDTCDHRTENWREADDHEEEKPGHYMGLDQEGFH